MNRRDLLKLFSIGSVGAMCGQLRLESVEQGLDAPAGPVVYEDIAASPLEMARSIQYMSTPAPSSADFLRAFEQAGRGESLRIDDLATYLRKMENFEAEHIADVFLEPDRYSLLISVFKRMDRVQNLVGHGNFNVLCFDDMVRYGESYQSVGEFPVAEKAFLEELFSERADRYGFLGEKVIPDLTARISPADTVKVPRTGHFLYRGDSYNLYRKLREEVGSNIVLTSGIRSIVKQTHLFLAKTIQAKGNLSRASRSLAPPGHSFHGIGDFDVGKAGFGSKNFTTAFAGTDEFKRLRDLGYVDMRYPQANLLGVRYEPWHIKVV